MILHKRATLRESLRRLEEYDEEEKHDSTHLYNPFIIIGCMQQ